MAVSELRGRRQGDGPERETSNGGRGFVAAEPVEKYGEEGQRRTDHGGVAGLVMVVNGQFKIIKRGRGSP